jgi:hypothetical protein
MTPLLSSSCRRLAHFANRVVASAGHLVAADARRLWYSGARGRAWDWIKASWRRLLLLQPQANLCRNQFRSAGWWLVVACLAGVLAAPGQVATNGPRGQPIRPRAPKLTNLPPAELDGPGPVTLPGGIVLTNVPPEYLPRSTNVVRLPTRAARKFEPLGYQSTSFTVLSRFVVKPPAPGSEAAATPSSRWEAVRRQIPEDVLAMDGQKVALAGFLLPLVVVGGRSTEFLLLRTQSACCFGLVPRVNELVMVKMAPPGATPQLDIPVVAAGRLTLKWIGEGDQLTGIYELQAEQVERAAGF